MAVASPLVKKLVLSALLLGSTLFSFGQDSTAQHELKPYTKLDLGLQGVGVTFERKLSKKATIDLSLGLGGGYNLYWGSMDYHWDLFYPVPFVAVTPKFFYNRDKRAAKGKSMTYNAGNYIGLRLKYSIPTLTQNHRSINLLLLSAYWGLQRPIGRKWTFNGQAGIGYATRGTRIMDNGYSEMLYPSFDFKFSYNFGKKNK